MFLFFSEFTGFVRVSPWRRFRVQRICECNFANKAAHKNNNRRYTRLWPLEGWTKKVFYENVKHKSFVCFQVSLEIPDKLFGSSFTTVTNVSKIIGDLMTVIHKIQIFSRYKICSITKCIMRKAHRKKLLRSFFELRKFIFFLFHISEHIATYCTVSVGFQAVVRQCIEDWDSGADDNRSERVTSADNRQRKWILIYLQAHIFNECKSWKSFAVLAKFRFNKSINIDFETARTGIA